ncbi:MAG TPA: hypothetical protein VGJ33_01150 [Candidatus Angelobacter sp.]|jgi:hypothetical protein
MKKLKNLLRPSLAVLNLALFAACVLKVMPLQAITIPSTAQVITNIQKLTGWQTCFGTCTATPMAVFSLTQGIASPSLSGSSAKFSLLPGTKTWGAALWFKTLGGHNSATHFVMDLNYYVDNPAADQAMEFYVTQNANGIRYNFGAQCDLAGAHAWRMWDNIGKRWVGSPVPCPAPVAKTWYHLTLEFQHQPGGELLWTAVTVNGKRSLVNLSMQHTPGSTNGLDIAYQSDANSVGAPFSVWLDKVSLTYW